MKNLLTLLLAVLFVLTLEAQSTGIEFSQEDWKTTLAKAQKEDKLIFVDCYTTWCGPCKWMAANVFNQEAVGDYYNKHFINVKLDMEKGEGLEFAKKYGIRAYPTLMFVNGEGKMMHKAIGSRKADQFAELGQAANDPNQQVGALMARYEKGDRDAAFLKSYASVLQDAGMAEAEEAAMAYLKGQKDWKSEESMNFIFEMADYNLESELYQYIAENRPAFYKQIGQDKVDAKLKGGVMYALRTMKSPSNEDVKSVYAKVFPEKAVQYSEQYELQKLMYSKDEAEMSQFIKKAPVFMAKYEVNDWQQLNSFAWRMYELMNDKENLTHARAWAKKSVEINSNYYNNDTLAAICYKLKEKEAALKHAEIAIAKAKEDGSDFSETQELLNKIKAMK